MNGDSEIKELLRESRDLQRAHFERYREFTETVLNSERHATEEAERVRTENQRYLEEMRRAVDRSQRQAVIVGAVFLLLILFLVAQYVASALLGDAIPAQ